MSFAHQLSRLSWITILVIAFAGLGRADTINIAAIRSAPGVVPQDCLESMDSATAASISVICHGYFVASASASSGLGPLGMGVEADASIAPGDNPGGGRSVSFLAVTAVASSSQEEEITFTGDSGGGFAAIDLSVQGEPLEFGQLSATLAGQNILEPYTQPPEIPITYGEPLELTLTAGYQCNFNCAPGPAAEWINSITLYDAWARGKSDPRLLCKTDPGGL